MQSLMRQPGAVGGLTALELQWYGHYVRLGAGHRVYLYTETRLAKWDREVDPSIHFEQRNANKLFKKPSRVGARLCAVETACATAAAGGQRPFAYWRSGIWRNPVKKTWPMG